MNLTVKVALFYLFVYARIIALIPNGFSFRKLSFEHSPLGIVYMVLINVSIITFMPYATYRSLKDFPGLTNGLFKLILSANTALLYMIILLTCIGRFLNRDRALKAFNDAINLGKVIYNGKGPKLEKNFLFKCIIVKTLLPVNQVIVAVVGLSQIDLGSPWTTLGHVMISFTYGNLNFLLNTFSLGTLLFADFFDGVNQQLESIFEFLVKEGAHRTGFPNESFWKCSEMSARFRQLTKTHSMVCYEAVRVIEILQFQLLSLVAYVFITNIFSLYQIYFMINNLSENLINSMRISFTVMVWWNLMDIFLLFYGGTLVNRGSFTKAMNILWNQFHMTFSNNDLDRSVSTSVGVN